MLPPRRWKELGAVAPHRLRTARLELHWAVRLLGADAGLVWDEERAALVGPPVTGELRAALAVPDLTLVVLRGKSPAAALSLRGETLASATDWLARALGARMAFSAHELPAHAVADGGAFVEADEPALAELARWVGDADLVLSELALHDAHASPVRCRPDRLDLATRLALGDGRAIAAGLSLGDATNEAPYFYVTPDAVLAAKDVVAASDQPGAVREFLGGAIAAARRRQSSALRAGGPPSAGP